jgi:sec-independent protein translocase protein TatC
MTFLEHLEELRGALIHSIIFIVIAGVIAWPLSSWLQEYVIRHVTGDLKDVVFMAGKPLGPLSARLKVTLAAACLIAAPLVIGRLWLFVSPGLMKKEKRLVVPSLALSIGLFYAGFLLSFVFMGPQVPSILLGFSTPSVHNMIAIDDVMSLVLTLSLACGLVGEVPLILCFLVWVGIVSPMTLVKQWRMAVVVILVVAALITPGDYGITMLLIALPIAGLYVLSVFLAFAVVRKRRVPPRPPEEPSDSLS